jgi:hypothetical protein
VLVRILKVEMKMKMMMERKKCGPNLGWRLAPTMMQRLLTLTATN